MATVAHRLLGISGSLRSQSTNTAVLKTLSNRLGHQVEMSLFALNEIPLYNSDLEAQMLPASVAVLKDAIEQADGLIICSPEYNYGTSPGVLGGVRAQAQLRETLSATLSRVIRGPQIVIPGVNEKIQDGSFIDEKTIEFMLAAVDDLISEIKAAS
jgi:chromate reductase, NAD(P)H dehydrogenase (quinone)